MESKSKNPMYDSMKALLDAIRDNISEKGSEPKKLSVNLDKLEVKLSGLKYPIRLSAKLEMDFSGEKSSGKSSK
ncbi:MAG: hypothetical protein M1441_00275 [Candidatus Parvarchaeota archaeon]|jgi:hypothetical protein|nr:hypothetical protein [Candidatus Parvarchaeota archaeon]